MPGSVSGKSDFGKVCKYFGTVCFLLCSLVFTIFGFQNNAWVVISRPETNDEFQRGIRGRDCYKNHSSSSIECWDNEFKNGTEPIPPPFEHVNDVSTVFKIAYYVVLVILVLQVALAIYTLLFCISSKFFQLAESFNYVMLGFMSVAVVLWIVLFVLLVPEVYKENILPDKFKNPEYNYSIGSGFWKFFCGGLIPFVAAIIIFFRKQLCNMFNCCGKDFELVANSN
ncbi:hypothetical protein GCK72_022911 [Caenorhabditis remanei]|uniref:Uncharacterized protein n=1 Tax=Caenorhabditis remanei TaxID=31234 RepID=A0A6A5FVC1_CAERE|nr:hypothetical protein GCK72_022911 [Caenorhabditis remanei]KAF1746455.1 hypothetical protein GCK72_022911 [Caenorhabditis remanei]